MNPCKDCKKPVGVKCCHNCKKVASKCEAWHFCGEDCKEWEAGILTNADRIRAMSDEDLAHMLVRYDSETDLYTADGGESYYDLTSAVEAELEWLQQPEEGE